MKLNITTTETRQKEIVIGFPTFTKIVQGVYTDYFAVISKDKVTRVSDFGKIFSVSTIAGIKDAFQEGFKMIDKDEFFKVYDDTLSNAYDEMEALKETLQDEPMTEKEELEAIEEESFNLKLASGEI